MLRSLVMKATYFNIFCFVQQRGMHSRNKKAMELIAKGWSALKEVDRVIDYCELNDKRLIPLLRTAKVNFELALEADTLNTHARFWLSKLHLKYHVPGACKAIGIACEIPWLVQNEKPIPSNFVFHRYFERMRESDPGLDMQTLYKKKCSRLLCKPEVMKVYALVYGGHSMCMKQRMGYKGAALLVEAADMGDPDAEYELGCLLRVENKYVQSDQQAFYYIEKAVEQLHPGALYLLGAVYLTGDCVKRDVSSALWCFHRASEKGHAGAAIAYGSLLLRGVQVPEILTKFSAKSGSPTRTSWKNAGTPNPLVMAREQFEIAAKAGCDLGFRWLKRIEEEEKRVLDSEMTNII
ncbi:hypothetical protein RJ639_047502 [Escallonia herrerae]|uniref:Binding protein n=1 Tax=Escallonia herrerae TaxID=1293975 RepID=A0AA88W8P3_9ASTE|nr:hypothetical protein RJ639_047502 [Escallonia herrerae]